jgi:hypothetical protein
VVDDLTLGCPALSGLFLGRPALGGLYLSRRLAAGAADAAQKAAVNACLAKLNRLHHVPHCDDDQT